MATKNSVFTQYNSFKYWQNPLNYQDLPSLSDDEKSVAKAKPKRSLLETMDKVINFVSDYNSASKTDYTFHFVGIRDVNNNKETQIFDNLSAITITTDLNLDSPLQSLHELIRKEFKIKQSIPILLLYSNSILADDIMTNSLKLQDCGVTNNSCFLLLLQDSTILKTETKTNDDEKKADLGELPDLDMIGLKQLVWTKSIQRAVSLDVITQENDVNVFRMPYCNHSMAKESLYQYILSEFKSKKESITCPHTKSKDKNSAELCGQMWDYPTVKQYLLVNDESKCESKGELQYMKYVKLEIYSERNIAAKKYKVQRCSQCKTLHYRDKNRKESTNMDFRSDCVLCSDIFCFGCGNAWSEKHLCDQSFRLQSLHILANCAEKEIDECECDDVPEIRACPKCAQLIHHESDCKHMRCNQCLTDFCFVCMTVKAEGTDEWPCGEYDEECDVHPRQNEQTLPSISEKNIFQLF